MAADYSFIMGKNILISYDYVKQFSEEFDFTNIEYHFDSAIKSMDFETIINQLKIFEESKPSYDSLAKIQTLCNKIRVEIDKLDILKNMDNSELADTRTEFETVTSLKDRVSLLSDKVSSEFLNSDVSMEKIKKYIKQNYFRDLSLRQLAKEFNFDYTNLSKKFYKTQGISYSKFLADVRLSEAMELIKTTDYKMVEISQMVGYNNYATFSRAFKDKYGRWPKEIVRGTEG